VLLTVTAEVAGSSPVNFLSEGFGSMTQANRRRGWAALMPAQSKIALHASGVDEIKTDTPPAWMMLLILYSCR
jgi:hypothetical protein